MDCTTDTGVISGLQQALGAGHIGVIQLLPMFPTFVTVAEIGRRMKQGITPLQGMGEGLDIKHVAFDKLHRQAAELFLGFLYGTNQRFYFDVPL